jgi:hypothetical protein
MPPRENQNEISTVTIRRDEFNEVRDDVKEILKKVNAGETRIEVHEGRIIMLEKVLYGGVGVVLTGVVVTVLGLVLVK